MIGQLLRNRITVVWCGLIAATLASWLLGVGHELSARSAGIAVLTITFIKVRFVGRYFMELRRAPLPLLVFFEAWVIVVGAVSIALFLV